MSDAGLPASAVDEVIIGNVLGPGGNPARSIALAAGLPDRVAGLTIDRQCSSGLDALLLARAIIAGGQADVVLAGGVESYTHRSFPGTANEAETDRRPFGQAPFTPWPERDPDMAEAADRLARELDIPQNIQDEWAVKSHKKALELRQRRSVEFAPVPSVGLEFDSFTRDLTPRLCARARTVHGSVTAANSSVAADAGAICVVVSESVMKNSAQSGLRLVSGTTRGGNPEQPGLAPIAAIDAVLFEAGVSAGDLSVAEVMEAYAVQAIACVNGTGIPRGIVNMAGGSLARGHPIGASGAILAVRLFHELHFRSGRYGVAAIASAGGIGTAVLLERNGS